MITETERQSIYQQVERSYPLECCGMILERNGERRLYPAYNDATEPTSTFRVSTEDMIKLVRLESEGWTVKVIYHSHTDTSGEMSYADRVGAREQFYDEAEWLIVECVSGRAGRWRTYAWDAMQNEYLEVSTWIK